MEVVELDTPFFGRVDPDTVLKAAEGKLDDVLLIGYRRDDHEDLYVASSHADLARALVLLEAAKLEILAMLGVI